METNNDGIYIETDSGDDTQHVAIQVSLLYDGEEATEQQIEDTEAVTEALNKQTEAYNKNAKAAKENEKASKVTTTSGTQQTTGDKKTAKKIDVQIKLNNKAMSEAILSLGKFKSTVDDSTSSVGNFSFSVDKATEALKRFEAKLNDISGTTSKKVNTTIDPATGFRQGGHRDKPNSTILVLEDIKPKAATTLTGMRGIGDLAIRGKTIPFKDSYLKHAAVPIYESVVPAIVEPAASSPFKFKYHDALKQPKMRRLSAKDITDFQYYIGPSGITEEQYLEFAEAAQERALIVDKFNNEFSKYKGKPFKMDAKRGKELEAAGMGRYSKDKFQFAPRPADFANIDLFRSMFPEVKAKERAPYLKDVLKIVEKDPFDTPVSVGRMYTEAEVKAKREALRIAKDKAEAVRLAEINAKIDQQYRDQREQEQREFREEQARKLVRGRTSSISREKSQGKLISVGSRVGKASDYLYDMDTYTGELLEYSPKIMTRAGLTNEKLLSDLASFSDFDPTSKEDLELFARRYHEIQSAFKVKGAPKTELGRNERQVLDGLTYTYFTDKIGLPHQFVSEAQRLMTTGNSKMINRKTGGKISQRKGSGLIMNLSGTGRHLPGAKKVGFDFGIEDDYYYEQMLSEILGDKYTIGSLKAPLEKRFTQNPFRDLSLDEMQGLFNNIFATTIGTGPDGQPMYIGTKYSDIGTNFAVDARLYDAINYHGWTQADFNKSIGQTQTMMLTKMFDDAAKMQSTLRAYNEAVFKLNRPNLNKEERKLANAQAKDAWKKLYKLSGINTTFEYHGATMPDPSDPTGKRKIKNPLYGLPIMSSDEMVETFLRNIEAESQVPVDIDYSMGSQGGSEGSKGSWDFYTQTSKADEIQVMEELANNTLAMKERDALLRDSIIARYGEGAKGFADEVYTVARMLSSGQDSKNLGKPKVDVSDEVAGFLWEASGREFRINTARPSSMVLKGNASRFKNSMRRIEQFVADNPEYDLPPFLEVKSPMFDPASADYTKATANVKAEEAVTEEKKEQLKIEKEITEEKKEQTAEVVKQSAMSESLTKEQKKYYKQEYKGAYRPIKTFDSSLVSQIFARDSKTRSEDMYEGLFKETELRDARSTLISIIQSRIQQKEGQESLARTIGAYQQQVKEREGVKTYTRLFDEKMYSEMFSAIDADIANQKTLDELERYADSRSIAHEFETGMLSLKDAYKQVEGLSKYSIGSDVVDTINKIKTEGSELISELGGLSFTKERREMMDRVGYTVEELTRMSDLHIARDIADVEYLRSVGASELEILQMRQEGMNKFRTEHVDSTYGKSLAKLDSNIVKGKITLSEYITELRKLGLTSVEVTLVLDRLNKELIDNAKSTKLAEVYAEEFTNEMQKAVPAVNAYARSLDTADTKLQALSKSTKELSKSMDTLFGKKHGKKGRLFDLSASQLSGIAAGALTVAFQSGRKMNELITEITFQASEGANVISWSDAQAGDWGDIDMQTQFDYTSIAEGMRNIAYLTTTSFTGMLSAALEIIKSGAEGATASAILFASALVADMEGMKINEVTEGMLGAGRAMGLTTVVDTTGKTETKADDTVKGVIQPWMDFYADVLLAADMTGSSVKEVMDGLRYFAPLVEAIGISQDEAIALSAILGNVGLAGQKGARTTASGLLRLAAPSDAAIEALNAIGVDPYDKSGNLKSINDIILEFGEAYSKLTDEEQAKYTKAVFGTESLKGFSGLGAQAAEYYELVTALEADETGKYMVERYASQFWGVDVDQVVKKSGEFYAGLQEDQDVVESIENVTNALGGFNAELKSMGLETVDWSYNTSETIMKNLWDLEREIADARLTFLEEGSIEEWTAMVEEHFGMVEEDIDNLQKELAEFTLGELAESDPFKVIGIGIMNLLEWLVYIGEEVALNIAGIIADVLPSINYWIEETNEQLATVGEDGTSIGEIIADAATLGILTSVTGALMNLIKTMKWPLWIAKQMNNEFSLMELSIEDVIDMWMTFMGLYVDFLRLTMVADVVSGIANVIGLLAGAMEFLFELADNFLDALSGAFKVFGIDKFNKTRFSKKGKSKQQGTAQQQILSELGDIESEISQARAQAHTDAEKTHELLKANNKAVNEVDDSVDDLAKKADKKDVELEVKLDGKGLDIDAGGHGKKSSSVGKAGVAGAAGATGQRRGSGSSSTTPTYKTGSTNPLDGQLLSALNMNKGLGPLAKTALGGIAAIPGPWLALISAVTASIHYLVNDTQQTFSTLDAYMQDTLTPIDDILYGSLPAETQAAMLTVLQSGEQIQAIEDSLPPFGKKIWNDIEPITQAAIITLGGVQPVLDLIAKEFPNIGKLIERHMTDEFKIAITEVGKLLEEIKRVKKYLDGNLFTFQFSFDTTDNPGVNDPGADSDDDYEAIGDAYSYSAAALGTMPVPQLQTSFGLSAYSSRGLGDTITNHNNNDNRVFNINYNVQQGREDTAFNRMVSELRGI